MRTVEKKLARRWAQSERRELVHAAGCTHAGCSAKWFLATPEWAKDPSLVTQGVRVPRSIRPILGLRTGDKP